MKNPIIRPVLGIIFTCFLFSLTYAQKLKKVNVSTETQPDFKALDKYISKTMKDFEMNGMAIAIVKGEEVVFQKAYGYKNGEKKIPLTTKSLFNIASCSKAFTAASMAALVDEKKLKWNDKVVQYLPTFQLADPYITKELNMEDILSHRSGLTTFTGDLLWYGTDHSDEEIIRRMRYLPIENDFRSEYGYQNNMYVLGGEVIEAASGKTWSEYLQSNIFDPLGMKETRAYSKQLTDGQDIALAHLEGQPQPLYMQGPMAAASIYSNVEELSNWITMLVNKGKWKGNQILEPQTVESLFKPRTLMNVSNWSRQRGTNFKTYALGWRVSDYYGDRIAEHSGGMPGYISKVTLAPDQQVGFVILTNNMNILTGALTYKILDFMLSDRDRDWAGEFLVYKQNGEKREAMAEEQRKASRVMGTKPSLEMAGYAGSYVDQMYGPAEITIKNDILRLTLLPTKDLFTSEMTHWHHNTFRIKFADPFLPEGFITFAFDSKGEVTGFEIDLPNPDFHFYNMHFKIKEDTD